MRDTLHFRRHSWHYRLWAFTFSLSNAGLPRGSDICSYVRRIVLRTIPIGLAWLAISIIWVVLYVLLFAARLIWMPFWGTGLPHSLGDILDDSGDDFGGVFLPYEKIQVGRARFYPYQILLPLALLGLVWLGFANYPVQTVIVVGLGAVVGLVLALFWGIQKSRETDLWQLITGYLRAKKEQICPLIIFEDQDD